MEQARVSHNKYLSEYSGVRVITGKTKERIPRVSMGLMGKVEML